MLPAYNDYDGETNRTLDLTLDSSPGDRNEIGLFTEWASECIATGRACDHVIAQADNLLDAPWCDLVSIYRRKWAGGEYGLSFEHTPNAFFLPYLLTGDEKYIRPMECQYKTNQEIGYKAIDGPLYQINGRWLSWQLRNLAELAYLEREGKITDSALLGGLPTRDTSGAFLVSLLKYRITPHGHLYRDALEATRQNLLRLMERSDNAEFRSMTWKGDGFNAWMEAFLGMTINHIVQLGFEEWRPIAQWHIQHLIDRCGGKWPMKYCSADYVNDITGMTWEQAESHAFTPLRMAALADYPDNQMTPNVLSGQRLTYGIRRAYLMAWAKLARQNNLDGAAALVGKLEAVAIDDPIHHKTNFR